MAGNCVCFPGFGDSFLYKAKSAGSSGLTSNVQLKLPVFQNGSLIPGCANYYGSPGCYPVFVADCGELQFVPGAAGRAAPSVVLLGLLSLVWLLFCGD
jgi:hypothetical protein